MYSQFPGPRLSIQTIASIILHKTVTFVCPRYTTFRHISKFAGLGYATQARQQTASRGCCLTQAEHVWQFNSHSEADLSKHPWNVRFVADSAREHTSYLDKE